MLDLDTPLTEHILHADGLVHNILGKAARMTVVPSWERLALLDDCTVTVNELRLVAARWFDTVVLLLRTLDQLQTALENLAFSNNGDITEEQTRTQNDCVVCGTSLTQLPALAGQPAAYCPVCFVPFEQIAKKLDSSDGFATWLI